MTSKRFWIGLLGLCSFTAIMIMARGTIDPLSLGAGIGMMIFPAEAAIAAGHIASKTK